MHAHTYRRNPAMSSSWITISVLTVCYVQGTSLLTELKVCTQPGLHTLLDLVCPEDYLVIIAQAAYRRSRPAGCHPTQPTACLASDVSAQLTMPCFFRLGTCKIKLVAANMPGCGANGETYRGDPYFHVLYKCQPLMLSSNPLSRTVDMCAPAQVSGPLVYLWNTNFPQYTRRRTCRCQVTTGLTAHVQVKMPHFKAHRQPPNSNCPQVIHFWSGSSIRSVCSEADDSFTPLQLVVNSSMYIEFDNPHQDLTQFWITLGVHHSQTMSVRCGPDLVFPPRPFGRAPPSLPGTTLTTRGATHTTTTMSTQAPARIIYSVTEQAFHTAQHTHTIGYIPIIAAVVGATLVIAIIIMVVLFGCNTRRKRGRPAPPPPIPSDLAEYSFDNDIYMTDGTRRRADSSSSRPPTTLTTPPPDDVGRHDPTVHAPHPGTAGGEGTIPKGRFLALEAPKGAVVPNPYAGLPIDSPRPSPGHGAAPSPCELTPCKKHSLCGADYEDLKDFHLAYRSYRALLRQTGVGPGVVGGTTPDGTPRGVAETALHIP